MGQLDDVKVNDPVMISDVNRGAGRARVTKIGHKYVYVGDRKFDRETGRVVDNYGHSVMFTIPQWEHNEAVERARKALIALGLHADRRVPDDRVLRMATLLKPLIDEAAS
jgi:hypothetical protein